MDSTASFTHSSHESRAQRRSPGGQAQAATCVWNGRLPGWRFGSAAICYGTLRKLHRAWGGGGYFFFFFFRRGQKAAPVAGVRGRAAPGAHIPAEPAGLGQAEVLSRLHRHPPVPVPLRATQAQRRGGLFGVSGLEVFTGA